MATVKFTGCMCKELTVISVNRVVDKNDRKKWRAEEEERQRGRRPEKRPDMYM
jgi:hypothetical protein